jgi:hypothetical protein
MEVSSKLQAAFTPRLCFLVRAGLDVFWGRSRTRNLFIKLSYADCFWSYWALKDGMTKKTKRHL